MVCFKEEKKKVFIYANKALFCLRGKDVMVMKNHTITY